MKYVGFNDEMIKILDSQINKEFECIIYEDSSGDNMCFGNLVLKVDGKLIEISNYEDMDGWDEDYESAHFTCKYVDNYIPRVNNVGTKHIDINETIQGINVIYDEVDDEFYKFNYDMAIEIVTDHHKYVISRGYYYSEIITISVDKEMDEIYPVSQVIEDWQDDDTSIDVKVNRIKKNIKERTNNN